MPVNKDAQDFELTFDQQQELRYLAERASTPSSNQNKHRFDLYAHVSELVHKEAIRIAEEAKSAILKRHKEELLAGAAKAERYGRANEHHFISNMLSNEELAALKPETLRGLKARQAELSQLQASNKDEVDLIKRKRQS